MLFRGIVECKSSHGFNPLEHLESAQLKYEYNSDARKKTIY